MRLWPGRETLSEAALKLSPRDTGPSGLSWNGRICFPAHSCCWRASGPRQLLAGGLSPLPRGPLHWLSQQRRIQEEEPKCKAQCLATPSREGPTTASTVCCWSLWPAFGRGQEELHKSLMHKSSLTRAHLQDCRGSSKPCQAASMFLKACPCSPHHFRGSWPGSWLLFSL